MPDEEHTDVAPGRAGESKYLLLVGGLLLIISMSLGWLWLTERARRITAQRSAARMQIELKQAVDRVNALQSFLPLPRDRTSRPSPGGPGG